jgi:hypothetical protein
MAPGLDLCQSPNQSHSISFGLLLTINPVKLIKLDILDTVTHDRIEAIKAKIGTNQTPKPDCNYQNLANFNYQRRLLLVGVASALRNRS